VIALLAHTLVLAGAFLLFGALFPIRRLIGRLPAGPVRRRWYVMTALTVLFLLGYLAYAAAFWNEHSTAPDLIVPGVFFFGGCFVWLTAGLSLQTTMDVMRMRSLERESATDALTGLFNRRYLDRRLREEVASARRYRLPLSVLLLDIDHFKLVNDRYGHRAGDHVLVTFGKLVPEELRESDILARYGGEEFLVIAPHTSLEGAADVAERLRKRIESHDFRLPNEAGAAIAIRLAVSIGVATLGDGVQTSEALVQAADDNLYRAKEEGRNRVVAAKAS
jgi:diguanylate cyclase (GGDEF)-like protein